MDLPSRWTVSKTLRFTVICTRLELLWEMWHRHLDHERVTLPAFWCVAESGVGAQTRILCVSKQSTHIMLTCAEILAPLFFALAKPTRYGGRVSVSMRVNSNSSEVRGAYKHKGKAGGE